MGWGGVRPAGCMSAGSMTRLLADVPQLTDLGGGQFLLQSHGPGEFLGERNMSPHPSPFPPFKPHAERLRANQSTIPRWQPFPLLRKIRVRQQCHCLHICAHMCGCEP